MAKMYIEYKKNQEENCNSHFVAIQKENYKIRKKKKGKTVHKMDQPDWICGCINGITV